MRRLSLIFTLILVTTVVAFAQIERPVKWSYAAKKTGKNEATLYIKAVMDGTWHIYSQNTPSGGPIKTSFKFNPSKDFTLVGKTIEPKPLNKYEEVFKLNVNYFEKEVVFQQKIKLLKPTTAVKGVVEFMACNEKKCLPPDEVEFSIPVK